MHPFLTFSTTTTSVPSTMSLNLNQDSFALTPTSWTICEEKWMNLVNFLNLMSFLNFFRTKKDRAEFGTFPFPTNGSLNITYSDRKKIEWFSRKKILIFKIGFFHKNFEFFKLNFSRTYSKTAICGFNIKLLDLNLLRWMRIFG